MDEQAYAAIDDPSPTRTQTMIRSVLALIGAAPAADPLPGLSGWRRPRRGNVRD